MHHLDNPSFAMDEVALDDLIVLVVVLVHGQHRRVDDHVGDDRVDDDPSLWVLDRGMPG